jgi:hypothetical protein
MRLTRRDQITNFLVGTPLRRCPRGSFKSFEEVKEEVMHGPMPAWSGRHGVPSRKGILARTPPFGVHLNPRNAAASFAQSNRFLRIVVFSEIWMLVRVAFGTCANGGLRHSRCTRQNHGEKVRARLTNPLHLSAPSISSPKLRPPRCQYTHREFETHHELQAVPRARRPYNS